MKVIKSEAGSALPSANCSRVGEMIASGKSSIAQVSIGAGVPKEELQAWLGGKSCPDYVESRVDGWLADLDGDKREKEPSFVPTKVASDIFGALEYARTTPTISLIYGGAGLGKTTAAKAYAKNTDRSHEGGTIYVAASTFARSPSAVLQLIAEAIGAYSGAYRMENLIREILVRTRPGDLFIIDEAQHLSPPALDGLRYFLDEGGRGIAYLGNETVFARINSKGRGAAFAQLSSRVGMRLHVGAPHDEDVDAILRAWSVSGRDERAYGREIASRPGALRLLNAVLHQSRIVAQNIGTTVTVEIMRGMAIQLGFGE